MAPRRQPASLQVRCVQHFVQLLHGLCQQQPFAEQPYPDLMAVQTVLQERLPQSLQAVLGERTLAYVEGLQMPVTQWHVHLLLQLRVRRLSVSGSVVHVGVLDAEDASMLQQLSLFYGGCGDRACKMYNFLRGAINLTHLQCTDFCNDDMLQIVARTCPHLNCLALHACDVTNEGVIKLCGLSEDIRKNIESLTNGENLEPLSVCAHSLKQIKLTMTKVTEAGVAIILLVLPEIQLLRVPDIQMQQLFTFLGKLRNCNVQTNLKEFHSREILDEFQLSVLARLCPNLEYVQVTFIGTAEVDIRRLRSLVQVKKLKGVKLGDVNSEALIWFMEEMGSKMELLHLFTYHTRFSQEKLRMTRRHLQSLARCCPVLNTLNIDGYSLDEDELPITDDLQYFRALQHLQLWSIRLTESDVRVFLSKCWHIQALDIVLLNPFVLQDHLINQFIDSGVWKDLVKVRILNSPITYKVLGKLVKECPRLRELGCLYTWLISKCQVTEFKNMVRLENLDLEIY
ncbi:uncharacterized protein LOC108683436 [Hyalella azteca]|uniref:Uncharacterized protein LOC108683436 n=1 Tax=Hyalella azteca TaxID=294128 RepID=A0A8B7PRV8_HYAAZ|nr:uncharacterized protein LOC108683436 [Hyalella azteca]